MAFSLPNFNLTCGIYSVVPPNTLGHRLDSPCNLAMGRRITWPWGSAGPGIGMDGFVPSLLLPPLTDVRTNMCGGAADVIEVPAGSGRWYQVAGVDDVGKGFPNEHRLANLVQISAAFADWVPYGIPFWPTPIP